MTPKIQHIMSLSDFGLVTDAPDVIHVLNSMGTTLVPGSEGKWFRRPKNANNQKKGAGVIADAASTANCLGYDADGFSYELQCLTMFPEQIGAMPFTLVNDVCQADIYQACADYAANKGRELVGTGYAIAKAVQKGLLIRGGAARRVIKWLGSKENSADFPKGGLNWIGGDNGLMVEVLPRLIGSHIEINVHNDPAKATGVQGLFIHSLDTAQAAIDQNDWWVNISGCKQGVQFGDESVTGFRCNLDNNTWHRLAFYDTANPLLIDSGGLDNNNVKVLFSGGGRGGLPGDPTESRDYIVRQVMGGIQNTIETGFLKIGKLTGKTAIQIEGGDFNIVGTLGVEPGTSLGDVLLIDTTAPTSRSKIRIRGLTCALGVCDSNGVAAKFGGGVDAVLDGVVFTGNVEAAIPINAIGVTFVGPANATAETGYSFVEVGPLGAAQSNGELWRPDFNTKPVFREVA